MSILNCADLLVFTTSPSIDQFVGSARLYTYMCKLFVIVIWHIEVIQYVDMWWTCDLASCWEM